MKKIKWKNIFLILFIGLFIFSLIKVINWYIDSTSSKKIIDDLSNKVKIEENTSGENVNDENIDKSDPYWDFIKMSLINIDFSDLKKQNKDTVGWIQVNNSNINYPIVKSKDNDYYLNRSFDKSYNDAGWIFMDYRNNIDEFDENTIIYGHARLDKTMFGTLKYALKNDWFNNKDNHVIKLSTEKENTLWQIFSVYRIPTTDDYIKVNFQDEEDFLKFLNLIKDRSVHNFNTSLSGNDKIITLSTCSSNNNKIVVHAKLIKRQIR